MAYRTPQRRVVTASGATTRNLLAYGPTKRPSIRKLASECGPLVYAVRIADGTVKIGHTTNLARRLKELRAPVANVLAFIPGDREDEQAIHARLSDHRAYGVEYYRPTAEVFSVVNELRERCGLPPIEEFAAA